MTAGEDRHQIVIETMEAIKHLVEDQATRRASANPDSPWSQVVDIEVAAAGSRLQRLSEELSAEGDHEGAALVAALIEDWLPVLRQELRARLKTRLK